MCELADMTLCVCKFARALFKKMLSAAASCNVCLEELNSINFTYMAEHISGIHLSSVAGMQTYRL